MSSARNFLCVKCINFNISFLRSLTNLARLWFNMIKNLHLWTFKNIKIFFSLSGYKVFFSFSFFDDWAENKEKYNKRFFFFSDYINGFWLVWLRNNTHLCFVSVHHPLKTSESSSNFLWFFKIFFFGQWKAFKDFSHFLRFQGKQHKRLRVIIIGRCLGCFFHTRTLRTIVNYTFFFIFSSCLRD